MNSVNTIHTSLSTFWSWKQQVCRLRFKIATGILYVKFLPQHLKIWNFFINYGFEGWTFFDALLHLYVLGHSDRWYRQPNVPWGLIHKRICSIQRITLFPCTALPWLVSSWRSETIVCNHVILIFIPRKLIRGKLFQCKSAKISISASN